MDAATTNTSLGGASTTAISADVFQDVDGDFSLSFSKLITGVTPGPHTFTLQWVITPVNGVVQKVRCPVTGTVTSGVNAGLPSSNFYHKTISAMEF